MTSSKPIHFLKTPPPKYPIVIYCLNIKIGGWGGVGTDTIQSIVILNQIKEDVHLVMLPLTNHLTSKQIYQSEIL